MDMQESNSALEKITENITFQIRKPGQDFGFTTVEERVNQLTNFELLVLIDNYLDAKGDEK